MVKTVFENRSVGWLKPHPLSREIYGDDLDDAFVESVRSLGVLIPLRVLRDGTIVSGRRRWMVAKKLKCEKLPCIMVEGKPDDLEVQEAVIHANRENERTVQQRGREFVELKRIETEKAEARIKAKQFSGKKTGNGQKHREITAPANLPEPCGEAAEIAAEAVGLSRHTAEKAAEVVEVMDELKEAGREEEAKAIGEKLEESVSAAHREARELKDETPPEKEEVKDRAGNELPKRLHKAFEAVTLFRSMTNRIGSFVTALEKMDGVPGCERVPQSAIKVMCKDIQASLRAAVPYAMCPHCKGHKCTKCRDLGWLHEDAWKGIPKKTLEKILR